MHCGFTLTATIVRNGLITLCPLCCIPHHYLSDKKNYWNVNRYFLTDFPVFTTLPSNASVEEGHTVTLTCRAKGPDTPKITWLREDGSGIPINIVASVDTQLDPSGDLKYTDTKSKHRGMHICKACNTAGCKMAKAFLDILCKWIISLLSFSGFGNDGRRRKCREKVSGADIFFQFFGRAFPTRLDQLRAWSRLALFILVSYWVVCPLANSFSLPPTPPPPTSPPLYQLNPQVWPSSHTHFYVELLVWIVHAPTLRSKVKTV